MRKFLVSAALLASTVAVAAPAPASAQWYPPQPQGYAYGYNNNYGQVRRLQVRIDQIQRQIVQLDRRNILSNREADRLREIRVEGGGAFVEIDLLPQPDADDLTRDARAARHAAPRQEDVGQLVGCL